MEQGLRLRALYRSLGWKRSECAQFFHVSARTLHNWESGATAIPYAVLKLLRIHARYELPGQEWNGWVFHSGKLWTPEGHGLTPHDAACWRNLSRRAQLMEEFLRENIELSRRVAAQQPDAGASRVHAAAEGAAAYAGDTPPRSAARSAVDLSKGHYSKLQGRNPATMRLPAGAGHLPFWSVVTNKKGGLG